MPKQHIVIVLVLIFSLFLIASTADAQAASVTVISPNGGEVWEIGSKQSIRWESSNALNDAWVALFLKPSGPIIKQKLRVSGSYEWVIPEQYCAGDVCGFPMKPADDYKIEARLYTGPVICDGDCLPETPQPTLIASDSSDAPFSIVSASQPSITVLSPSSGPVGTLVTITGSGFTPTGNKVNFGLGTISKITFKNSATLSFIVPFEVYREMSCPPGAPCPAPPVFPISPGVYNVSVTNAGGTSNALPFKVTADGCKIGGCSSQLCRDASEPDIATTCESKPEYACYKEFGMCERQASGQCGWTQTAELVGCIGSKICPQISPPSPDFCPDGKVQPKYDENNCIAGYDCIEKEYCGSGTPNADCYCREGEIKEEYSPKCPEGLACAAVMLYKCVPGVLEVKTPSSFSLSEGQTAWVVNYGDMKIRVNKITFISPQIGSVIAIGYITVTSPGGCGPDADPRCLGSPSYSKDYEIREGGTVDAIGLKITSTGFAYGDHAKVKIASFKISAPVPVICPKIYKPVCGVDGVTYGNSCMAAGIEIAYEGKCTQDIAVKTSSGLGGAVGKYFQAVFVANGGVPPYSWSVSEGELPSGLTLASPPRSPCGIDPSGVEVCETVTARPLQPVAAISIAETPPAKPVKQNVLWLQGIPVQAGTYKFQLTAKDQNGNKGSGTFVVTISSNALLERYLIIRDIGDYKFIEADVRKENVKGMDVNVYVASYGNRQQAETLVVEFSSREEAERGLELLKKEKNLREDKINGNSVLVDTSSQQNVVLWTHRNFIIMTGTSKVYRTATQAASTGTAASEPSIRSAVLCTADAKRCPDGKTYVGRIGPDCEFAPCPDEGNRKYCGSGTPNADCYCREGEIKEEYSPRCPEGLACAAVMLYKCVPQKQELPLPVVHAYLEKYPSDLGKGTTGKEITEEELLDIAFRLENLKRRFDQLQRNAVSLSGYYKSINDTENAERFAKVADILGEAKIKIDGMKERIRENLDNPEGIIDEIKEGIKDLKSMMRQVILVILGGPAGKEEATGKAQPLFGSV